MYEAYNGIAKIDGNTGRYDNSVTNPSVRYGRNAIDNYYSYLEKPIIADTENPAPLLDHSLNPNAPEENADKLDKFLKNNDEYLKALPPLEFEYRYMPNIQRGQVDKNAVLGAAYEEMGKRKEMSVKEMDALFAPDENYSSAPIDINKDGKIDVSEYGATILASDMLSKSDTPDMKNIDGTINRNGFNAVLAYTHKSNAQAATNLYSKIYNTYQLGNALKTFNPEA